MILELKRMNAKANNNSLIFRILIIHTIRILVYKLSQQPLNNLFIKWIEIYILVNENKCQQ